MKAAKFTQENAKRLGYRKGMDIAPLQDKLLNRIESVKMMLLHETDPSTQDRLQRDIQHLLEDSKELVRLAEEHEKGRAVRLEPLANKERKRVRELRKNAPKGGKATAHYTDSEVTAAFTDYKTRNPGKSAWDAANALIRKGAPLDKWKHPNSAWNRTERIADKQLGITRQAWFDNL